MDSAEIDGVLEAAERSVFAGSGLSGTRFWGAVALVKADRPLVDRYADRIAAIDQEALQRWAMLTVPLGLGTTLMSIATLAGLALVGWTYALDGLPAVAVFAVGLGALLVTTHGLAHLVVGRLAGIRFTTWFVGPLSVPLTGGVKIDYGTYLRAAAKRRAWMHASGAIVTKLVPFALVGAAIAADLPAWAVWGVIALGVANVVLDLVWSTKRSDWKRFRREMTFARSA
ncbi:MAG TPA: hypothetical protein VGC47_04240 [Acidimicrobiia bacterium]|jgi:hypothetical protein